MLDERARTMKDFTADHRPLNVYAVFRRDLEMPSLKLVAQCGHAFDLAIDAARKRDPGLIERYRGTGMGNKPVMYSNGLAGLQRAYEELEARGIPCQVVIDRNHVLLPHFDGQPIITAIGFGPVYKDEVSSITKRFTMLS